MKKKIKVLVADDSDFVREFIIDLLSEDDEIQVIAEAANGKEAFEKVISLKPDIVTMDIEMPIMGGIEAIERIMSSHAVPILVVTSKADANTAYEAISKGALEVIQKPNLDLKHASELIRKIKLLSKVRVITHLSLESLNYFDKSGTNHATIRTRTKYSDKIVAIASSTGGPKALSMVLAALPKNYACPIIVAQHIPDDFISGMAEWLDKCVTLKVKAGLEGEFLIAGTVYLSPSERHMKIDRANRIAFQERRSNDIYFPSCNILLSSAADVYRERCIGVILTGMGNDGVIGMKDIKKAGGVTIAQDEATSVIFGMPKVAIDSGCIDMVLPVEKIAEKLIFLTQSEK